MEQFFSFSDRKNWGVFVVLLCFSIGLFMLNDLPIIHTIKNAQESVFYPFRTVVRNFRGVFENIGKTFESELTIRKQLEAAKSQVLFYQEKQIKMNQLKVENARLREVMQLKSQTPDASILAEVIATDPDYHYTFLTLNKGLVNGLRENLPVVAVMGSETVLVGLIKEVTLFTSKVITLNSQELKVGSLLANSGVNAVVEGSGKNLYNVDLLYVDRSTNLAIGEEVLTSPLSSMFPPYLKIGRVSSIETTDRSRMSYRAMVKIYVKLNRLKHVFVLKSLSSGN